jgi:Altronate dehydratase
VTVAERVVQTAKAVERPHAIRIRPSDDVAVLVTQVRADQSVAIGDIRVGARADIPAGHKIALRDIASGDTVRKYGFPIGHATADIKTGDWVHSHNLTTALSGSVEYRYEPRRDVAAADSKDSGREIPTFMGYRRANARVGTRNEIWILNTVGCVNHAAERIARGASDKVGPNIDGVHAFSHPYGCSQLGDDLHNTQRVLAGLMRHPNAGGVLVLGLGCESNQIDSLLALASDVDRSRLKVFNSQDVMDEIEEGGSALGSLMERMQHDRREECPASELILGHKCGGSDGFSGITANPLVGRIADRITGFGGGVLLTEVPEMFGAEQVLMSRAAGEGVFNDLVAMINGFKDYFIRHGQPIYENPSPGNKEGGLTTLEEKSLGAIQKGGHATVRKVLRYGEQAPTSGLSLLESPGNDGVSSTAMVVSGATLLLFTTGRGTPLGFPVPTIKISSNNAIAAKKPHWIDFSAGGLLDGTATQDELADQLLELVLDIASGRKHARNEEQGYREIAIWKEGVTL